MPNWYAEDDNGHTRCYYGGQAHELSECDRTHTALHAKWDKQRNMKPLPASLQKVADARVFVVDQAYYDHDEDDRYEDDYDYWDFFGPDGP